MWGKQQPALLGARQLSTHVRRRLRALGDLSDISSVPDDLRTFTGLTVSAGWGLYLTLAASVSLLLSSLALAVPGRPAPAVDLG